MIDRYTKIVLTVIAGALVYLCVVMTASPPCRRKARSGQASSPAADRGRDRRLAS